MADYEELKEMAEEVSKKVAMQKLFDDIIVPEMGGYFSNYPVNFEGDLRACCPLHSEDTPSFRYYPDSNSFYCFGCRKGGNVVKLFQLYSNIQNDADLTYYKSAELLYNKYIKGQDIAKMRPVGQHLKLQPVKPKHVNSNIDIVRLNSYRVKLERQISSCETLDIKNKEALWKELDTVDLLLEQDKDNIDVIEVKKYLIELAKKTNEQYGLTLSLI